MNVLITGSSSGFGLRTASVFASAGARVFASARHPEAATDLKRAAEAQPGIELLTLDVLDASSITAAIARVESEDGVDVLVNNAGIELRGPIELVSDAEARRQFDTNVFGVLALIRAAVPGMRARGRGVIVNVSSIAGLVARPFGGLYAASKHALEAISEALHYELQPFGIRVALIEPGQYATALQRNSIDAEAFDESSPYWDRCARFDVAIRKLASGEGGGDANEVARAIHRVATDPKAPLRTLVGSDAELIAKVKRERSFEEFEQLMRQSIDWHD